MSARWEEFHRYAGAWHASGDRARLRLIDGYHEGMRYRESHSDHQFEVMTQCRDEARRLNEPWWVLFFEGWRLDALTAGKHDFGRALPLAIELMTRFSSPEGLAHPNHDDILLNVLYIYSQVDPFGHRDELERGFEVLAGRIGNAADDGRLVLNFRKAEYYLGTERWDEAHELAQLSLDLANLRESRWHRTWTLFLLCRTCHSLRLWDELAAHAEVMAEQSAASADLRRTLADAWLWLALTQQARGDERRAARSFQTGMRHLEGLDRRNEISADPIAEYYELLGNGKAAVGVRDRELEDVAKSGALHRVALINIERCRLLKVGGELGEADIRQAREAAERMHQPTWYLKKLDQMIRHYPHA
jgi:hypothetical protein